MRTESFHPGRRRAFTLVELLVCIGIIALLLSILLPALSLARSAANATKCATNVRSIATAALAYANENNGMVPRDLFGAGSFFAANLAPHVGYSTILPTNNKATLYDAFSKIQAYHCPALKGTQFTLHYTVNSIDFDWYQRGGGYRAVPAIQVTRFPQAAQTIYVIEINPDGLTPQGFDVWDCWDPSLLPFNGTSINASPRAIQAADQRHKGRTTVGFLDGHVETKGLTPGELPVRLFNPFDPR